ncbi:hypothetical protein FKM82_031251, partial [Ascaphus truei]
SLLSVQVPEYCNKEITRPLQVYFYISNGRRKRSPMQTFRYLPIIFKEEPLPELALHRFPSTPLPPPCHIQLDLGQMDLTPSFVPPNHSSLGDTPMEVSPYYTTPQTEQVYAGGPDCALGSSPFLGGYFSPPVPPEFKCPPSYSENGGDVSLSLPYQSNTSSPLPPSPVPWSPQPCSSHSACSTFGGPLLPHISPHSKLEERGATSHENYQSSTIPPSLKFDVSARHFSPGFQPFSPCTPPLYTPLGKDGERVGQTQPAYSSLPQEVGRAERCVPTQQCPSTSPPNPQTHPTHTLHSETGESGAVAHSGFLPSSSKLPHSEQDGMAQTFPTTYQNLSSCSPPQLISLRPPVHPSPFSSPPLPSPVIPSTPTPSLEVTSDTAQGLSPNQNEREPCYQPSGGEYSKSGDSERREVGNEDGHGFESPFQPIPIQGITLEEVSEFIGQDLQRFPEQHQED